MRLDGDLRDLNSPLCDFGLFDSFFSNEISEDSHEAFFYEWQVHGEGIVIGVLLRVIFRCMHCKRGIGYDSVF